MDKDYFLDKFKGNGKGYDYYNDRSSINITQKKYCEDELARPKPVEIIQDCLYWISSDEVPK